MGSQAEPKLTFSITETELGLLLLAGSKQGLQYLAVGQDVARLESELRDFSANLHRDSEVSQYAQQIIDHVKLGIPHHVQLDPIGTDFQKKVWSELEKISWGQAITYSELARRVGNPKAVRAVASACGANNLAIVIPCHRVIGSNGKLTGFRWGIEVKRQLLHWEGVYAADTMVA